MGCRRLNSLEVYFSCSHLVYLVARVYNLLVKAMASVGIALLFGLPMSSPAVPAAGHGVWGVSLVGVCGLGVVRGQRDCCLGFLTLNLAG